MKFQKTILKYNMISPGDHVLAAVSGGADSVALLCGFVQLKGVAGPIKGVAGPSLESISESVSGFGLEPSFDFKLSVCHINHNLRGPDALEDADYVKELCAKYDLPLYSYSAKINTEGRSLEDAARQVRYNFLYKAAKLSGANKIATGHNQNDNAETLLLRLCRGTGPTGLCGIPPISVRNPPESPHELIIIRPLIETNRTEIESYLKSKKIPHRTDLSNYDKTFSRNRIRLDVIPALQKINPQAISQIAKSAELLQEDENLLNALSAGISTLSTGINALPTEISTLSTEISTLPTEINTLHIPTLKKAPPPLRKRAIRAAIKRVKGTSPLAGCGAEPHGLKGREADPHGLKDISQKHIDQIEALLHSQTGKVTQLPGGLRVKREYDNLLIFFEETANDFSFCYEIPMSTPIFVPVLGHYIQANIKKSYKTSHIYSANIYTKYFNYDKINEPIELRTRRPGDRIAITGEDAKIISKKLKNELIDKKVPRVQRDSIPLLAVGNDILWIMNGEKSRTSCAYTPEAGCNVLTVEVKK